MMHMYICIFQYLGSWGLREEYGKSNVIQVLIEMRLDLDLLRSHKWDVSEMMD